MLRPIVIAAAAMLTAGTMLTAAAGPAAARTAPEPKATDTQSRNVALDSSQRICLNRSATGTAMVTGSIISRQECRTRADWAARGIELPAVRR